MRRRRHKQAGGSIRRVLCVFAGPCCPSRHLAFTVRPRKLGSVRCSVHSRGKPSGRVEQHLASSTSEFDFFIAIAHEAQQARRVRAQVAAKHHATTFEQLQQHRIVRVLLHVVTVPAVIVPACCGMPVQHLQYPCKQTSFPHVCLQPHRRRWKASTPLYCAGLPCGSHCFTGSRKTRLTGCLYPVQQILLLHMVGRHLPSCHMQYVRHVMLSLLVCHLQAGAYITATDTMFTGGMCGTVLVRLSVRLQSAAWRTQREVPRRDLSAGRHCPTVPQRPTSAQTCAKQSCTRVVATW